MVLARKRALKLFRVYTDRWDKIDFLFRVWLTFFVGKTAGVHFCLRLKSTYTELIILHSVRLECTIIKMNSDRKHLENIYAMLWNTCGISSFEAKFIETISIKRYNEHTNFLLSFSSFTHFLSRTLALSLSPSLLLALKM